MAIAIATLIAAPFVWLAMTTTLRRLSTRPYMVTEQTIIVLSPARSMPPLSTGHCERARDAIALSVLPFI